MSTPPVGQQPVHPSKPGLAFSSPPPKGVGATRDTVAPAAAAQNQPEPPGVFERGIRAIFRFLTRILTPVYNFVARIFRPIGNFLINVKNKIAGWFSSPKAPEPQPEQQEKPLPGTNWTAKALLESLQKGTIPTDPAVLFQVFEKIVDDDKKKVIYEALGKNSWYKKEEAGRALAKENPQLLIGYLLGALGAYAQTT